MMSSFTAATKQKTRILVARGVPNCIQKLEMPRGNIVELKHFDVLKDTRTLGEGATLAIKYC